MNKNIRKMTFLKVVVNPNKQLNTYVKNLKMIFWKINVWIKKI